MLRKYKIFIFYLVFTCIFCFVQKIQAQDYDLAYQHITTEKGLSNNFATAIIQDKKGFIWIGTQEGLNKYDGYSFKIYTFNLEKKYNLNSNHITFLEEDKEKNCIWIGTATGLSKLHTEKDTIENIPFFDKKHINYIYQDSQNTIWVASDKGIYREENQKWIDYSFNLDTNKNYSYIGEQSFNGQIKQLLVITTKEKYDVNDVFYKSKHEKEWKKILSTPQNLQYIEENGKIWTSYKVEQLKNGYNKVYDKSIKIDSIYFEKPQSARMTVPFLAFKEDTKDKNKSISNKAWFSDAGGIALINLDNKKFETWYYWKYFVESMDQYAVQTIFRDASQNYWICTQGMGVFIFADYTINNFRTYKYRKGFENSLSNPSTRAIYQDATTKNTWIGTYSNKNVIDIFAKDSIKKTIFIDSYVHLIKQDPTHQNLLWCATSSGIRKIDKDKTELLETYSMNESFLSAILPINDSTLWAASKDRLYHFNPTTKKFISYPKLKDISHFYYDSLSAQIWVGSFTKGIGLFNDKKISITYYNPNEKQKNSVCNVKYIHKSSREKDIFWVATTLGFYKFDSQKKVFLKQYTQKEGLPNDVIYVILEDEEGNLWGSTNHGIFKFNPKTEIFTNFDKQDGLQDNEFNTFSYFKSKEGELFFGGINGVNAFFPKNMKKNEFVAPLYLTHFEKLGKEVFFDTPISEIKQISLDKEEAQLLTFRFAALSFYQSNKNKYAYKIEPLQKEWIQLGTQNELTLTNLSAGNYTLHIKGSNNHGFWNEKGITLKIKIIPPFYQTMWFQVVCICAVLAGIYFYYKLKLRQSKIRSQDLERQVEERTHEIQVQTEELQITNEKLKELDHFKEKTTNMLVHDLKNPLGTIIYEAKDNLPIRKASQRMMNLLMALLDSQKIQSPHFELNLEKVNFQTLLESVLEEIEVFLIEKEIQIIYEEKSIFYLEIDKDLIQRVLVNLFTNAIKYSLKRSFITISISEVKKTSINFAQITVTDTGRGIHKNQIDSIFDSYRQINAQKVGSVSSTGLGLSFCKLAVEAHLEKFEPNLNNNDKIWVNSIPNQETNFHFIVPLVEIKQNTEQTISNKIPTIPTQNAISTYPFSKTELDYLIPFVEELKTLEVYQATQIRSILSQLNDESTTIAAWKNEMHELLYRVDEDEYQKLLNLNIDPKGFQNP